MNLDPDATHTIESVTLYGSLTDQDRLEVTDVDVIAFAQRRRFRNLPGGTHPRPEHRGHAGVTERLAEQEAATDRATLEALLRAGHDRLDISVVDERSDIQSPIPPGSTEIEVFRRSC